MDDIMKNLILILLIVNSLFAGWMNVDSMNVKQKWRNKKFNTDALLYIKDADSLLDTCNIYYKSGEIGIGTSIPDGTVHIFSGDAGAVTVPGGADDLIIENLDNCGILILSPDADYSQLYFGSPSIPAAAFLQWNHDNDLYRLGTIKSSAEVAILSGNSSEAIRIDSNQYVGINTTTPTALLHVNGTSKFDDTVDINENVSMEGNFINYAGEDDTGLTFSSIGRASLYCTNQYPLSLDDNTPLAEGIGGGVLFDGVYNSIGNITAFSSIHAYKTNATDGNTSGQLHFKTKLNGGGLITNMILDENGNFELSNGKMTLEEEGLVLNRTGGGGYISFQDGSAVNNWQIAHTNTDNKLSFWSSTIDGILNIGKVKTGTMFHLNTNNGRIGIGTDAADGNLHVFTATAGTITPSGSADEIIIENSTNAGMTILSPNANYSSVFFGSPSHSAGGAISWKYDDKKLLISTTTDGKTVFRYDDNIEAMRINDEGHLGIGDSTPGAKLTIAEGPDTIKIEAAQWGCVAYTTGQFAGGVSDPDMAAVGGTSLYQPHFAGLASLEEVHGTMKVPADALSGDTLFFSTRAAPATTGAGNYTFHFYYSVINNTGTTTITSIDDSLIATTAASGTAYEFTIIELGYITGLEPNECLLFRFFRDPADATDTYGADVCCIGTGFKYRIASLGQITK